jgi:hypothetical protein
LELALLLHNGGHEVYYTDSSDSVFTSGLLKKGIGRIVCPGDFRWFTPDLVLLDYQLQNKSVFYRQQGITFIFVAIQILRENEVDKVHVAPVVYLPPSEQTVRHFSPRLACLLGVRSIRKELSKVVIAGLLEEEGDVPGIISFYKVIKQSCENNTHFQIILLTNSREAIRRLFPLPDNMAVYRLLDLRALLPNCDVALITSDLNTLIESIYANLPFLAYSESGRTGCRSNAMQKLGVGLYKELQQMTPEIFEQQIATILNKRKEMQANAKQLNEHFKSENRNLGKVADFLLTLIKQKKE